MNEHKVISFNNRHDRRGYWAWKRLGGQGPIPVPYHFVKGTW